MSLALSCLILLTGLLISAVSVGLAFALDTPIPVFIILPFIFIGGWAGTRRL